MALLIKFCGSWYGTNCRTLFSSPMFSILGLNAAFEHSFPDMVVQRAKVIHLSQAGGSPPCVNGDIAIHWEW